MQRRLCIALLALAWAATSGCGVIFQTVYGWNDQVEREGTRTYPIAVTSDPPGALVTRLDQGNAVELGPSPALDVVPVAIHETVDIPKSTWPMFIGAGLDVAIALVSLKALGSVVDEGGQNSGEEAVGLFYLMIGAATGAFADLIFAAIYSNAEVKVVKSSPILDERPTSYLAVKEGYKSMMSTIRLPWDSAAKFKLVVNDPRAIGLPGLDPSEPGRARTSTISE